jgi:lysozyme
MTTSPSGIAFIKEFEGLYLKAYKCPADVWTIGYGHTGLQHEDGTVYPGRKITKAQADELLAYDLHQYEARVNTFVKVPLRQHEFDALVSFDFNTGSLHRSTLLLRLNDGDKAAAANEFGRWNKVSGKPIAGLTRRRLCERRLFLGLTPAVVEL